MAPLETVLPHCVEERTSVGACVGDVGQMAEIPICEVSGIQALGRVNAKTPETGLSDRPTLTRMDTKILGEDHPAVLSAEPQPVDIWNRCAFVNAIVLSKSDNLQSRGSQSLRDAYAPEAAVEEDFRQPRGM